MKYRLTVLKNGNEVNWIYDNSNNHVYDESGKQLLTEYPDDSGLYVYPFTRTDNPYRKGKYLFLMEIVLGSKCNFHCEYCSQAEYRNMAYDAKVEDVDGFIEKLKASGIQEIQRIQFWGGEPYVYWKVIEKLTPKLRELFPNASISAPSNGSLLTREKVDFMKRYNMYCFISHDGPKNDHRKANSSNQHSDILDDPKVLDAIRYAQQTLGTDKVSFGVTPTSGNTDVLKIVDFFKSKVGEQTHCSVHNIVRCHNSHDAQQVVACKLSQHDLDVYSDTIFKMLNSGNVNDFSMFRRRETMINSLLHKASIESVRAECPIPFSEGIVVDLRGKVLQCHNHAQKDQTFGDLGDLHSIQALGYNQMRNKQRCLDCLVCHLCKGGCPSADDRANELACPNLFAMNYGVFKGTFASLFGVVIKSYKRMS